MTRLPFPVQVVERVETIDWIGRSRLVTRYAYHHGYFDAYEREFRGFGLVEPGTPRSSATTPSFDDGDFVNWDQRSWSPPVLTRTWFHTGAFDAGRRRQPAVRRASTGPSPALRGPGQAAAAAAMRLPDTVLPDGLDPFEEQEAYRALKGRALRTEMYADDGSAAADNPYTVTEQNFTVRLVQHQGPNLHAVFLRPPARDADLPLRAGRGRSAGQSRADPGNRRVRERAAERLRRLPAPRRATRRRNRRCRPPPSRCSAYDQARLHVRGTEHGYTNAVDDTGGLARRLPGPAACVVDSAEITGVTPPVRAAGITNLFTFDDIDGPGRRLVHGLAGGHRHRLRAGPGLRRRRDRGAGRRADPAVRRAARVPYRADDLSALLGPGELRAACAARRVVPGGADPGMVSAIFGSLVPAATLTAGGYVQLAGETGGGSRRDACTTPPVTATRRPTELAAAMISVFLPVRAVDPLGAITRVGYDAHRLLPASATDAVGNVTSAVSDYRVLLPATVTDPNGNRVSLAFDVLGRVTATAVMGKVDRGGRRRADRVQPPTWTRPRWPPSSPTRRATRRRCWGTPPPGSCTTRAPTSGPAGPRSPRRSPSTRWPARPTCPTWRDRRRTRTRGHPLPVPAGLRRRVRAGDPAQGPGGAGSGQRRGAVGHLRLDDLRQQGPAGPRLRAVLLGRERLRVRRRVRCRHGHAATTRRAASSRCCIPTARWEKTTFGPWLEQKWDGDDTVLVADPRSDPDVGDYFTRLLGTAPFTSWYDLRIGGQYGSTPEEQAAQQDAARKTAPFAATPATTHLDSVGRACLAVADNGPGVRYPVRTAYDTEGKPLAVFDELGRRAEEHCYRSAGPRRRVHLHRGHRHGRPARLPRQRRRRRAAHPASTWPGRPSARGTPAATRSGSSTIWRGGSRTAT